MGEADSAGGGRCRAVTSDGERCRRAAGEDGFCHQHGPNDETVDAEEASAQEGASGADDVEVSADGGEAKEETEEEEEETEEEAEEEEEAEDADSGGGSVGIVEVRDSVEGDVPALIGHPFDGVVEIQREDDGWYAVVEVVERSAVPDTQDIIGRYAVELGDDAEVESYRLIERFKRGDVTGSLE